MVGLSDRVAGPLTVGDDGTGTGKSADVAGALIYYYHWLDNQPLFAGFGFMHSPSGAMLESGARRDGRWNRGQYNRLDPGLELASVPLTKRLSRNGSSSQIIKKMKDLSNASALEVDAGSEGQRVDNFLMRVCKGVPRSHIYRILRTGEVRVNSGRVDATYRLQSGDRVRIPPMRVSERPVRHVPPAELPIVFEDEAVLVVDKPAGVAVHGGSGVSFGVIEQLRAARPQQRFLELVHRLDRETSGLLILAKKRAALTALHADMREGRVRKRYLALVKGAWKDEKRHVSLPLRKYLTEAGERRVSVDREEGRESATVFRRVRSFSGYTLVSAELLTGRTHQIRVHLAHLGFPIAGDDKYGDFERNRALAKQGLKRMFLHAAELEFTHPATADPVRLAAPLPPALEAFLQSLGAERALAGAGR